MGSIAGIARRDAKRAPMQQLDAAAISRETGVANDFRGRPGDRQVTLLSADAWRLVCSRLQRDLPWTMRRSNLLIDGMDLPKRIGEVICIGKVRLEVTMEVAPCSRMDEQCSGLLEALSPDWRGGVACTVLQGGDVRIGDAVLVEASSR